MSSQVWPLGVPICSGAAREHFAEVDEFRGERAFPLNGGDAVGLGMFLRLADRRSVSWNVTSPRSGTGTPDPSQGHFELLYYAMRKRTSPTCLGGGGGGLCGSKPRSELFPKRNLVEVSPLFGDVGNEVGEGGDVTQRCHLLVTCCELSRSFKRTRKEKIRGQ